jgi:hypothetical protein
VSDLAVLGTLRVSDGIAVGALAEATVLWKLANLRLRDAVRDGEGTPMILRLSRAAHAASGVLARWLAEFGLTPSSSARVHVGPKTTETGGVMKYVGAGRREP